MLSLLLFTPSTRVLFLLCGCNALHSFNQRPTWNTHAHALARIKIMLPIALYYCSRIVLRESVLPAWLMIWLCVDGGCVLLSDIYWSWSAPYSFGRYWRVPRWSCWSCSVFVWYWWSCSVLDSTCSSCSVLDSTCWSCVFWR